MLRGRLLSTLLAGAAAVVPVTVDGAEGPTPGIVVRPLEIEGDVGEGWKDEFQASFGRGLARQDAELVRGDGSSCGATDEPCWQGFAASEGAKLSVRGRVVRVERDYEIKLELLTEDGEVAATAEQTCELCGLAEVAHLLEDIAGTLASRIDSLASAKAVILFESAPPGATLLLDGQDVGTTPMNREVAPGAHRAEAVLDGHVSQRRSFEAEPGVDETIRFALPVAPRDPKVLRALGWASLGLGTAAVVSGAVLIAIDEDPITSRCSGDNVNSVGVCKYRRNTLAGGIALVASGAAGIVAGTVIAIVTRRRKTTPRTAFGPAGLRIRF